ncbi:putative leucine-rich repeat-containing protein [Drosophila madeirensis]|uniref:Leucine-rich repeat-containing protein n=1 Tax=Drosophila madeirensis TaxID=30013 RepID=A0AAU9ERN6_DROMD
MIGRIPICRRPIHCLGLLRPSLRSAQISPIAERRLKHGMGDSGEESLAKARTRLRQVKTIKVRQGFCKKENPARDGAATSGLMTEYVGHAKEESMSEAKDELTSEAKNGSMCEETKVSLSDSKNEPISETNDAPQSDAKDEPFTTEIPQERRQESPFECRPELPMKGQPATPTQPLPAVVNPKNPYPVVTCQQDQDAAPSSSEEPEGKVKTSGKIIFKDNSQLETKALNILPNEAPSTKGESMNVWAQSYASDVMDPAKNSNVDSAAKGDKTQIILEFQTQASKVEGNNSPSSEKPNEIVEGKQQNTEELYPTTPKGYEIGCVIHFSDRIQSSRDLAGKAEQAVETNVHETKNLEDKIQKSSRGVNEEKPAKAIEEVKETKNSTEIQIKSPTNSLPIRIVRNEDGSPVDPPPIIKRIPSSELKSDKDAPPEESSSSKYKRNLEFIQTEPVLTSDAEMKLVEPTSVDLSPEKSKKVATEMKPEIEELQSKTNELQAELKELQLEATEQKSEATEQKSEAATNESNELQSEMKELQSKATEQKSESTEAVSASQMGSQNTPKSAAEIISMLELKQKAMKSMSRGSTLSDPRIKSTSQIVATFGLRPEPGQGFRAKGTLNNTELDRQADEYFTKINEHETSQMEKKMEPESKIESETSKLANIMEPESSQLPKTIDAKNSQLDNKMDAETVLPESKVEQVETPEESNRKAEEYFENIAELEISQLDRQMEESKSCTFEELSAISKADESSELETKVEEVQNPNEPKEYTTFKAMVKERKADEYFAKINEAEISQLDGKIEPESSQLDGKMETKTQKESKTFEVMSTGGKKEQTGDTDLKETSKEINPDDDISDKKVEDKKELPTDRPLFVPADDKDRLIEKSALTGGDLYKPQSEDPRSDDFDYDSKPTTDKIEIKEKPRSKPKLEDGELDVKLLVPDETTKTSSGSPETTAAPAKQNFVQFIFGKIFRQGKKTPPTDRTMSTDCQRRDLNTSSTLLYPEHDDILDDPHSPEVGKVINPDDKDFISPDLERQGLGARTIHEERYDQPQAMKKDNPVGVWSIIKLKAPLNTQPSKKMSMAMPMLRFSSDDKGSLKVRSGSPQCKNQEKTTHEELMKKKENQENKSKKMEQLKKEPKDDDCKRSFSSYFEGFTKMFWSSSISDADPSKKDK